MNSWLLLAAKEEREAAAQALANCRELPANRGVVIGSGGSGGFRRWCLQPWSNLEASANSSAAWLKSLGLEPSELLLVNPLPGHHIGGLMPWVRSRIWQVPMLVVPPQQLRQPASLAALPLQGRQALISLVPTQLHRLLAHPAGIAWLRQFALIWVGGAGLARASADRARQLGVRLAPCYGSTETAAMVTALAPDAFLAGEEGCGAPLMDVELRVRGTDGAIQVRCERLSPGWLAGDQPQPIAAADGWWSSGDAGRFCPAGLQLLGRLDGALNSGGATVFPEQIEAALAQTEGVEALLVVGLADQEWGQRLVGLLRLGDNSNPALVQQRLLERSSSLPPAQRPKQWLLCSQLAPNAQGKWERPRWQAWAQLSEGTHPLLQP
jgi:O-succinylbenzoic acid--CoA ligase